MQPSYGQQGWAQGPDHGSTRSASIAEGSKKSIVSFQQCAINLLHTESHYTAHNYVRIVNKTAIASHIRIHVLHIGLTLMLAKYPPLGMSRGRPKIDLICVIAMVKAAAQV